jgi:hypothetical protein
MSQTREKMRSAGGDNWVIAEAGTEKPIRQVDRHRHPVGPLGDNNSNVVDPSRGRSPSSWLAGG